MNTLFSYWKEYAENDWKVARLLFKDGDRKGFAYQACVFHCHQTIEKMMKAILVSKNIMPPKIHDLVSLSTKLGIDIPEEIQICLDRINPHYMRPRYPDLKFAPGFHFTYNKRNTEKILIQAEQILVWLKKQLKKH